MANKRNVLILLGLVIVAGVGLAIALNQSKSNICPFLKILSAAEVGNSSDGAKADFLINVNNTSSGEQIVFLFLTPLDTIMQTTNQSSASVTIPVGVSQLALSMNRSAVGKADLTASIKMGDVCHTVQFKSNASV